MKGPAERPSTAAASDDPPSVESPQAGDQGRSLDYVALPPMSPTIAPKPMLYVVEQVSVAALT